MSVTKSSGKISPALRLRALIRCRFGQCIALVLSSLAFDLFYTDGTDNEFFVNTTDMNWDFFNVTSDLSAGKILDGLSIFGNSGGTTFVDDFVVDTTTALPEPASLALLARPSPGSA